MDAAKQGHELYVFTHNDFNPEEQLKRSYTSPSFNPNSRFGETISHWKDGKYMKQTLNWTTLEREKNGASIVPKLQDDFRERSQPQLWQPLDPWVWIIFYFPVSVLDNYYSYSLNIFFP